MINPALLYLAPTAMNLILAGIQGVQAGKHKMDRPEFKVPSSAWESLSMSQKDLSQTENPYAAIQREDIGASTSRQIGAMEKGSKSGSDILSGLSNIVEGERGQNTQLAKENIAYQQQAKQAYQGQLGNMSNWQNMAWQYNQADKFKEESATRSALMGAAIQNAGQGITGGFTGAAGYLQNKELMEGMYGNTGGISGLNTNTQKYNDMLQFTNANKERQALPVNDMQMPSLRSKINQDEYQWNPMNYIDQIMGGWGNNQE